MHVGFHLTQQCPFLMCREMVGAAHPSTSSKRLSDLERRGFTGVQQVLSALLAASKFASFLFPGSGGVKIIQILLCYSFYLSLFPMIPIIAFILPFHDPSPWPAITFISTSPRSSSWKHPSSSRASLVVEETWIFRAGVGRGAGMVER